MRKNKSYYLLAIILIGLSSCEFFKIKESEPVDSLERPPVARAHDAFLYAEDLEGIVPKGMSAEDSVYRIKRYVDSWARKQLLIKEAQAVIDFDEVDIERKILDYRYSLMGYEYQSFYINSHLSKDVSEEEIEQYYKDNIDNFILKQNIIKGKFVNLPNEAPKTESISKLIRSKKVEDHEKLMSYCLSYATTYQLRDTVWMNFDDIVISTPLSKTPNKVQLLKTNDFIEASDSLNTFYLHIIEYKITDEQSPLEFVKDQIRDVIINKRKIELANKLEEDVYEKAVNNNDFEIYND